MCFIASWPQSRERSHGDQGHLGDDVLSTLDLHPAFKVRMEYIPTACFFRFDSANCYTSCHTVQQRKPAQLQESLKTTKLVGVAC
jgi:hypothetical protein